MAPIPEAHSHIIEHNWSGKRKGLLFWVPVPGLGTCGSQGVGTRRRGVGSESQKRVGGAAGERGGLRGGAIVKGRGGELFRRRSPSGEGGVRGDRKGRDNWRRRDNRGRSIREEGVGGRKKERILGRRSTREGPGHAVPTILCSPGAILGTPGRRG